MDALSNRANALIRLKRHEEALADCDKALTIEPASCQRLAQPRKRAFGVEAASRVACLLRARAALDSTNAATWNNHGNALVALKRYAELLPDFDAALALDPVYVDAFSNKANALSSLKNFPQAIAAAEAALALDPDHAPTLSVLVHCGLHACDWRALDRAKSEGLRRRSSSDAGPSSRSTARRSRRPRRTIFRPRGFGWRTNAPVAATAVARRTLSSTTGSALPISRPICAPMRWVPDRGRVRAARQVAVRDHRHLLGSDDKSETRARIEAAFDHFIDAREKSDNEVAALLREMEIDIAVDLNGFTGDPRTRILARRPAPIQVNYLGYPGTMGAEYIDYIIADPYVITPSG